jgi:hypothetical protein
MPQRRRQTFEEALLIVAPRNAQSLERKAYTASSLAQAYPEIEWFFCDVARRAAQQLSKLVLDSSFSQAA